MTTTRDTPGAAVKVAAALLSLIPPSKHGQLCPVWTQRMKPGPRTCDCWQIEYARRDAPRLLAALDGWRLERAEAVADTSVERVYGNAVSDAERDWEEYRKEHGWPTPNHMRRAADALDVFTPAKYGDILRWIADACDAALAPEAPTDG